MRHRKGVEFILPTPCATCELEVLCLYYKSSKMITACRCYRVGDVDLFSNHTDVTEFQGVLILLCYFNVVVQRRPERDILFTSFTSQSELQTQNDVSNKVIGNRTKSLKKVHS